LDNIKSKLGDSNIGLEHLDFFVYAYRRVVTRATHPPEPELFGKRESPLRIAISVDMPDTGIDIPEAVNLVFFKVVRSKTRSTSSWSASTRQNGTPSGNR
jgi:hypothetical protein